MNDASENDKDLENPVKDSEAFKKQHAAVLLQLKEVNKQVWTELSVNLVDYNAEIRLKKLSYNVQVSLALVSLRERNRYQRISPPPIKKQEAKLIEHDNNNARPKLASPYTLKENISQVDEIVESSRTKAKKVVDVALEVWSL